MYTLTLHHHFSFEYQQQNCLFKESTILFYLSGCSGRGLTDIREFVTKRKVSGGTRSQDGKKSRDTFLSLKKTCRKLGVSFWRYLNSRLKCDLVVPRLESILRLKAAPSWIKKVLKKLKENLTKVVFFFFWKNHYQRLLRCYIICPKN